MKERAKYPTWIRNNNNKQSKMYNSTGLRGRKTKTK
jgi:hypothetical protein